MGGFFGGGAKESGPSAAEIARQEKERKRVEDIETSKKDALKRKRRGRGSLISDSETGIDKTKLG